MVSVRGRSATSGRRKVVWGRRTSVLALVLLTAFVVVVPLIRAQQPRTSAAQEGFVPAKDLPSEQDQVPAAPLVMTAYAVAWTAILIYMWSIWQRLNRVQREIADVSRRVGTGARR
jgi:CcmD family protein